MVLLHVISFSHFAFDISAYLPYGLDLNGFHNSVIAIKHNVTLIILVRSLQGFDCIGYGLRMLQQIIIDMKIYDKCIKCQEPETLEKKLLTLVMILHGIKGLKIMGIET